MLRRLAEERAVLDDFSRLRKGTRVKRPLHYISASAAVLFALCGIATGVANAQATAPAGPPAKGEHEHHWGDPAAMKQKMEERRRAHEQVLHDALGLRADQEGAWQAFIASTAPPEGPGGRGERMHREEGAQLSLPERLDRMLQRMNERQSEFQRRAQAIKTFYAALDARQQKTFEALISMRFNGRERGEHGFGGHPGPGDREG